MTSKYKHSYIYQSKHTEEEDIPTAICVHQGNLYAGYVNNNFLVEFNLEVQKPVTTIQFQAESQISTNRYLLFNKEWRRMEMSLWVPSRTPWSEYLINHEWCIVLRLMSNQWCLFASQTILTSCSVAGKTELWSYGTWESTLRFVLLR